MALADLKRDYEEDFVQSPLEILDWKRQLLEPTTQLTDPEWVGTIYFDPTVFLMASVLERIEAHYARVHENRVFRYQALTSEDLQFWSPFKFALAEEVFRSRGFVADIDVINAGKGQHDQMTTYLKRNVSAACHQIALLRGLSTYEFPDGETPAWQAMLSDSVLAALIGDNAGVHRPLIERDGLLLPCADLRDHDPIHLTYNVRLSKALEIGKSDEFHIRYATLEDVSSQSVFELSHSRHLFGGAEAETVVLWHCHVLGFLRKAAWRIDFDTLLHAKNLEFEKEKQLSRELMRRVGDMDGRLDFDVLLTPDHVDDQRRPDRVVGPIRTVKRRLRDVRLRRNANRHMRDAGYMVQIESAMVRAMNDAKDAYADDLDGHSHFERLHATMTIRFDDNAVLTAALNGATFVPDIEIDCEDDLYTPILIVQPLAMWVGKLKGRRFAMLDAHTASLLAVVANDDGETAALFTSIVEPRLTDRAWDLLADAAQLVIDGAAAVPVLYEWTRDLEQPYGAELRDGTIVIRGPMLDFPTADAERWNSRSADVRREGALVLQRRVPNAAD